MSTKEMKIQWHAGFCAAMQLEFIDEKDKLTYETEHTLNTKPLQIDMLIVKKNKNVKLSKAIGAIFKGHNLVEFKSPRDHMNIDTYFKVIGYASLYKSYGATVDEIKSDDITLTFVRERKPRKLFSDLEKKYGCKVDKFSDGIYYVQGAAYFLTQVIVTEELPLSENVWLHSLTDRADGEVVRSLIESVETVEVKGDRNLAESVLEVVVRSNEKTIGKIKEDKVMCEALRELMKPEIDAEISQAVSQNTKDILSDNIAKLANDYLARGIAKDKEEAMELATALLS